ncbi:MAG TPA: hypothetical protein VIU40_04765, partial [Geobacteraceae bacterium]
MFRRCRLFPLVATLLFLGPGPAAAELGSFHWADRDGFHAVESLAQVPLAHRKDLPMARNRTALPFAGEEDADGAMYVWFILGQAGFDYPYVKGADRPASPLFSRKEKGEKGDIA